MASLLRLGRYFPRYIRNLQSVNLSPAVACSNTFLHFNPRNQFHEHPRTLTTQIQAQVRPRRRSQLTLDDHIKRIDALVRKLGRLSRRDFDNMFYTMKSGATVTPRQSLLLLRCCGVLLSEELPQTRNELVAEVLATLNSMGAELDISHYNALLKVYLDNEYKFNAAEFSSEMEKKGIVPNRVTYQRLIALYCQSGDLEGAKKVLEHMKENGIPVNEKVFNSLIMGHGRAHDLESAIGILDVMKSMKVEPTVDTYAALTLAYAESGDIKGSLKVLAEAEEKNLTLLNADYLNIIYTLAKNGHAEDISSIIDKLQSSSFGFINECVVTIQKLVNCNQHETAFCVLTLIEPLRKKAVDAIPIGTFFLRQLLQCNVVPEVILDYCRRMVELNLHSSAPTKATELAFYSAKSEHFFLFLKELRKQNFPIRPHYFWPFLLKCKNENTSKVYEILQQMMDFECPANYGTFKDSVYPVLLSEDAVMSNVIKKLEEVGYTVDETLGPMVEYFVDQKNMKQAAVLVDEGNCNLRPRSLCVSLARSYIVTGDVTSTMKVLKCLIQSTSLSLGQNPQADWTGLFLIQCFQFGLQHQETLEQTLNAIKENNLPITQETRDTILRRFGSSLPNSVTEILKSISTSEFRSTNEAFDNLREMDIDSLEAHLVELKNKEMNTRGVLRQLLQHYCRIKNFERIKEIRAELDEQNFIYSPAMLSQIMDASVANENLEEAQQLFTRVKENHTDFILDDYKRLNYATLLIEKDQAVEAVKVLKEWKPHDRRANDDFLTHNVRRLLNACADKRNVELTENMLKLLIDRKCCKITGAMLGPVVKVYLETDLDKAIARFEEIAKTYSCAPLSRELFKKVIAKEDHKNLQKLVDINNEVHGEVNTLHDLAFSFIECGRTADARKIFVTPGMRGLQGRLETCCAYYLRNGLLREMEDLISVTSDLFDVDRDKLYLYLIRGYYEAKDPKKALEVWTLMQEENVCASDATQIFLAKFLKEFNVPVPFVVPDEQALISSSTNEKTRRPQLGKRLTSELSLRISQASTQVRSLVEDGNLDDALKIIHSLLDEKHFPEIGVFRFTVNELARNGDLDRLKALEPKLTTSLRKILSFNNMYLQAHVSRGTHEEFLSELERNVSNTDICPAGGFIPFLKQHPELLNRVEKLAKEYTKYDYFRLVNSIWVYHFMNENYDAADKIFKEIPSFLTNLSFRSILNEASIVKNVPMLERLLKIIKETQLPVECTARVYQEIINTQCALQDTDAALETLEMVKKEGMEKLINSEVLLKLKTKFNEAEQSLP